MAPKKDIRYNRPGDGLGILLIALVLATVTGCCLLVYLVG
jgi:hypothetical protein